MRFVQHASDVQQGADRLPGGLLCGQVLVLLQRLASTLQDILAAEHFIAAMAAVVQATAEHAAGEPIMATA